MKTSKSVRTGKVLTSVLVLFMLLWVILLSSCTATLQTPRHVRTDVFISGQVRGERQNGGDRQMRRERRQEQRERHD